MSIYSVWTQIIDNDTTPENIEDYGSVHDVFAEQEDDDTGTPNKQFCDGQTSKTPPRYAQDNMVGIYTRSEESAQIVSDFLRENVSSRIASGELAIPQSSIPTWYKPPDIKTAVVLPQVSDFSAATNKQDAIDRLEKLYALDEGEVLQKSVTNYNRLTLDELNRMLRTEELDRGFWSYG